MKEIYRTKKIYGLDYQQAKVALCCCLVAVLIVICVGLAMFSCTQPVEVVTPDIYLPELIEAPECKGQIILLGEAFEDRESWDITEGLAFDVVGCLIEKARVHKENANVCREQVREFSD